MEAVDELVVVAVRIVAAHTSSPTRKIEEFLSSCESSFVALSIKDPEIDRLAREPAGLSGLPIASAVRDAIEKRLAVLRSRARATPPGLDEIIIRGRARATVDARPEEEILGYDTRGLPE